MTTLQIYNKCGAVIGEAYDHKGNESRVRPLKESAAGFKEFHPVVALAADKTLHG